MINEPITLTRDCEAIEIPYGSKVTLPAGLQVRITQALGGTYTVVTEEGYLVRIAGTDADALGMESEATTSKEQPSEAPLQGPELEQRVWDQLRTIYDPEIPVNVVDLGLIYECKLTPLPEGGHRVDVKMTLTAPGCGMGDVLKRDAEIKLLTVPGIKQANVEIVFDPPWDRSRMSEAAQLQLGMYGMY